MLEEEPRKRLPLLSLNSPHPVDLAVGLIAWEPGSREHVFMGKGGLKLKPAWSPDMATCASGGAGAGSCVVNQGMRLRTDF